MVGKGIIGAIIMIVVALFIFGALAGDAIINATNTTALTAAGVSTSTIAIYGLVGLIALVAIIMMFLKIGTGGR